MERGTLETVFRRVEAEEKRRTTTAKKKKPGKLDAMDVLLGNGRRDLAMIGYVTLRRWEERMKALKESS